MSNSIEDMSLADLQAHIEKAQKLLVQLRAAQRIKERDESARRRAQRIAREERLNEEALKLFESVEVGDMVRIVGMRNTRYDWRLVTSKSKDSFTGWQYYRNKKGEWVRGYEHTAHMSNKIREMKKDHGVKETNW